jgi:HSP20 family molecular chaperone IbpA
MAKSDIQCRVTDSIDTEITQLERDIRELAYTLSRDRHELWADPTTDWLSAERALVWKPAIEVRQKDGGIEVRAALPGVETKDIEIEVAPQDILIKAHVNHEHTKDEGDVHTCEFAHGNAFRSVHLPMMIDANTVKTEYRNGVLRVSAAVSKPGQPQ